jgi:DNA-binding transcriptional ArsR family regulator
VPLGTLEPSPFGITPKAITALADPVRLRILTELQLGDLSPSDFAAASDIDLGYASRCFRQLCDLGYAEISEVRGAHRGGASVERIYHAPDRSLFAAGAAPLPAPARRAAAHPVIGRLFRFASAAIEAGTFDSEAESVIAYDKKALETDAWAELVRLLDGLNVALPELEAEAGERIQAGDSESMHVAVAMTAFEAPHPPFLCPQPPELLIDATDMDRPTAATSNLSLPRIAPEMAKGLSNRSRSRILMELAVRPMSPSRFVEEIGGETSYIARCFRELDDWGLVEVDKERRGGRRGGGVERIYRNARYPHFDDDAWRILPRSLLNEMVGAILTTFMARAGEAIEEGTLDSRGGRHLTCRRLVVDRRGWQSIRARLGMIFERLPKLEAESIQRNGGGVEGLIPAVVGLASFRLPPT